MVTSITSATPADPTVATVAQAQPAAKSAASSPKPAQAKPTAEVQDTVKISVAAQALQEATETPQQTAKEAQGGDQQAKRLVAKETAAEKALQ